MTDEDDMVGKTSDQRSRRGDRLVTVLVKPDAFLRQIVIAKEAVAAPDDDRPGNAVAESGSRSREVDWRCSGAEGFDPADDLVAEDRRGRAVPPASVGMEVAAAEGAS